MHGGGGGDDLRSAVEISMMGLESVGVSIATSTGGRVVDAATRDVGGFRFRWILPTSTGHALRMRVCVCGVRRPRPWPRRQVGQTRSVAACPHDHHLRDPFSEGEGGGHPGTGVGPPQ